jgi:hypothetical protein
MALALALTHTLSLHRRRLSPAYSRWVGGRSELTSDEVEHVGNQEAFLRWNFAGGSGIFSRVCQWYLVIANRVPVLLCGGGGGGGGG